jgi:uncharacterized protein YbjT (DUF2867 family)
MKKPARPAGSSRTGSARRSPRVTAVAVVGATGKVGHELAAQLLARGVPVRALGRNPEKLADLTARGAEPRSPDVHDVKAVAEALRGVHALFAMIPPNIGHAEPREDQRQVADAIAAGLQVARVRHVVTLSSLGADLAAGTGPIAGLRAMEERFNRVPGLNVVHLRAAYHYENLLASIPLIKSAGVNGGIIRPDVPIPMVATRDIAAAAADLLSTLAFTGQRVMELPGPRDYTMAETARIIGAAIGRPDLRYVQFSEDDTRHGLLAAGCSPGAAEMLLELFRALDQGLIRALEPRSASTMAWTSFEDFARSVFLPAFQH